MSETLKTYEVFMRESSTSLKIVRYTCQAATLQDAQRIFEEQHGQGRIIAGPNLVKPA